MLSREFRPKEGGLKGEGAEGGRDENRRNRSRDKEDYVL
jgi:hypothetical protein